MHYVKAKSILSPSNGMNLYRGCTHGCIYCDSRSLCYHMNHAFEDIEVKENAIELLDDRLIRKRKKCMIGLGAMSDPYMPIERTLCYTRRALEAAYSHGFGFTLITKSDLVLRDIDILKAINEKTKCVIQMTLTTYDDSLCRIIEPNAPVTSERARTLKALRDAGIPTVIWLSPILPFINDTAENISGIMEYAREAGAYGIICFGMGLTLREGNREYFYRALDKSFPGIKKMYIERYGMKYIIDSPNSIELNRLFCSMADQYGIIHDNDRLFRYLSEFEDRDEPKQLTLFD